MGIKVNRTGGMVVGSTASGGSPVSGTIDITENGVYDVSSYASADVDIPKPTEVITFTQNNVHGVNIQDYGYANVEVPEPPEPSGKISITENGNDIDVSSYALADVNVSGGNTDLINLIDRSVTSFNIPNGVRIINGYVFKQWENLTSINIPNSVVRIGYGAFENTGLVSVTLHDDIVLDEAIFSSCINLATVYFNTCNNGEVTAYLFSGCSSLTNIYTTGFKKVGEGAFENCSNLTSVIIDSACSEIGDNAFAGSGLTDIYFTGSQTDWGNISIGTDAIPQGATIHYDYVPQ